MQASLSAFLQQAGDLLERLEPLLPPRRPLIDWQSCLAARWQHQGGHGHDQVLIAVNGSLRNGRIGLPAGHWVDLHGQPSADTLPLPARNVTFLVPA